ncbi:MAG: Na/Pi symporter, partial [Gammaproteobacteria bacterium]
YEVWHFLAGLGLFLYGISRIENAMHDLGGRKFVQILHNHTKNPVESIISGTVLTALLQSSSLVSLMVLAFVGSQFIPMQNALGIIMGANLGTTFTGWVVAIFGFKLDIEQYSLPIIALGALGLTFISKNKRARSISKFIFGFGLLLFGLGFMKSGMEDFASAVDITKYTDHSIFYFFILGIIVTAIIQSSSAMMAVTLSALSIGTISLPQAAATVVGADLGTTITVVLGALSGASAKKQVALFHVSFNLIIDILSILFLPALLYLIVKIFGVTDPLYTLVLFHNTFNAIGIFLFLPFLSHISKYIKNTFKENKGTGTIYIKNVDHNLPTISFDAIKLEIEHMIIQVIKLNMQILKISTEDQTSILGKHTDLVSINMPKRERYEYIKRLESEIISFSIDLKRTGLSNEETSNLALWTASVRNLVHSARSLRSIRHDLAKLVRVDDYGSYENKNELIKNTKGLYKNIINLLSEDDKDSIFEQLANLEASNINTHDKLVEYIYDKYAQDISTPLNIVREIFSSNKALINALKEYKFDIKNLTTFENLPRLVR